MTFATRLTPRTRLPSLNASRFCTKGNFGRRKTEGSSLSQNSVVSAAPNIPCWPFNLVRAIPATRETRAPQEPKETPAPQACRATPEIRARLAPRVKLEQPPAPPAAPSWSFRQNKQLPYKRGSVDKRYPLTFLRRILAALALALLVSVVTTTRSSPTLVIYVSGDLKVV